MIALFAIKMTKFREKEIMKKSIPNTFLTNKEKNFITKIESLYKEQAKTIFDRKKITDEVIDIACLSLKDVTLILMYSFNNWTEILEQDTSPDA